MALKVMLLSSGSPAGWPAAASRPWPLLRRVPGPAAVARLSAFAPTLLVFFYFIVGHGFMTGVTACRLCWGLCKYGYCHGVLLLGLPVEGLAASRRRCSVLLCNQTKARVPGQAGPLHFAVRQERAYCWHEARLSKFQAIKLGARFSALSFCFCGACFVRLGFVFLCLYVLYS